MLSSTDLGTGRGNSDDWVETYYIQYATSNSGFQDYKEDGQRKVFAGNFDRNTEVKHTINAIRARQIRFRPITFFRNIAFRVQVRGFSRMSLHRLHRC